MNETGDDDWDSDDDVDDDNEMETRAVCDGAKADTNGK